MDGEQESSAPVEALVRTIERAGMVGPVRLCLDILAPLDIISAQVALFVSPFTAGSRWREYAAALSEERGWGELRRRLQDPG